MKIDRNINYSNTNKYKVLACKIVREVKSLTERRSDFNRYFNPML